VRILPIFPDIALNSRVGYVLPGTSSSSSMIGPSAVAGVLLDTRRYERRQSHRAGPICDEKELGTQMAPTGLRLGRFITKALPSNQISQ
ncbi:MAG: hypothetical protein AAAC50_11765, partial [Rhizobium altiplani]|uniref:hypothetical protein n=1 Tax=Rhizobium altiplani TaxID=1864509 RepID=UPI0030F0087D